MSKPTPSAAVCTCGEGAQVTDPDCPVCNKPIPSAAEHPPKCQLCNHGPHSDSVGHSYLPKIERSEQQEWTEQTVEETFKVTFPNSGIIPLPKFLKAVADAHNAALAAASEAEDRRLEDLAIEISELKDQLATERRRREQTEREVTRLSWQAETTDKLKMELLSAQAAIKKDREDAGHIYRLVECAEKTAGKSMTFDEVKGAANDIQSRESDLSLLHQHDAEVYLKAFNDASTKIYENPTEAQLSHDAEVRKPLVEALEDISNFKGKSPYALAKRANAALAQCKEG